MKYPECEKLSVRDGERRTVVAFLEWLEEQGYWPTGYALADLMRGSADQIARRYLGVDEARLDKERRGMLNP